MSLVENLESAPLPEGAADGFEERLAGPGGAKFYRECRTRLMEAEVVVRRELAKGVSRAEADRLNALLSALGQSIVLLEDVWRDVSANG